jgi:hypothetical protein
VRNPQDYQQTQNPEETRVLEKSDFEGLKSFDEKMRESKQPKTLIQQEVQETNTPTIEEVDATQFFDIDTQPPKLELATDAVEISVEESGITEKTSIPSILGESEPETLIQQEKIDVEDSSKLSSRVEKSSTLPSTKTNAGKKHRTFELGDRVVLKDVGGIYQGARGYVVDILESRAGTSYLVKFDKPIKNIPQIEVKASDLMKL